MLELLVCCHCITMNFGPDVVAMRVMQSNSCWKRKGEVMTRAIRSRGGAILIGMSTALMTAFNGAQRVGDTKDRLLLAIAPCPLVLPLVGA